MGFWIFMLIMDMLVPITMIGFGSYCQKSGGPKEINPLFGYRSSLAMKNVNTWRFAHTYIGRLSRVAGYILTPVSAGVMLFMLGKDIDTVGTIGGIVCGVQCVFFIALAIFTEIELKKNFDKDGNRR
jgi:hypothetical protein